MGLAAIDIPLRLHSKDVKDSSQAAASAHSLANTYSVTDYIASYGRILGHALTTWIDSGHDQLNPEMIRAIFLAGTSLHIFSLDFYLRQTKDDTARIAEKDAYNSWDVNRASNFFDLRWLANRVLADNEELPADDVQLRAVILHNSQPTLELIDIYKSILDDSGGNLLVCIERPETIRFLAIILYHLNLPFSALYKGIDFSYDDVVTEFNTTSPRLLLCQYWALHPHSTLGGRCKDVVFL